MRFVTRRTMLRTTGIAAAVGLAGCSGDGGGDGDGGDAVTGDDYPTIDDWLTETDVGSAEGSYDGEFNDSRGQEAVTVEVGASGNNGNFAFAPAAVVVSTGTTVEFEWTGEGNPHNVVAAPGDQIGESDYTFSSGDSQGGSGVQFTQTLEEAGVVNYHCGPHLNLGMKGGIAVESDDG